MFCAPCIVLKIALDPKLWGKQLSVGTSNLTEESEVGAAMAGDATPNEGLSNNTVLQNLESGARMRAPVDRPPPPGSETLGMKIFVMKVTGLAQGGRPRPRAPGAPPVFKCGSPAPFYPGGAAMTWQGAGGWRAGREATRRGGVEFWRLVTSPGAEAPTTRHTRAHQQNGLALEKRDRATGSWFTMALATRIEGAFLK